MKRNLKKYRNSSKIKLIKLRYFIKDSVKKFLISKKVRKWQYIYKFDFKDGKRYVVLC